jgi:hypothetical protein
MSEADSRTAERPDNASQRDVLSRLSRSLTTVRLGVPLLDDVLQPTGGGGPALLRDLCAATLTATLDLAALSGRLIREQRTRVSGTPDRRTGGPG